MMSRLRPLLRAFRDLCLLTALSICGATWLPAAPYASDAVDQLQQALQAKVDPANQGALDFRKKTLEQLIGALRPGEYRKALALIEWRDKDPEITVQNVDRAVRQTLIDKMSNQLRAIFAKGSTPAKLAAITAIAEMGTTIRSGALSPQLADKEKELYDQSNKLNDKFKDLSDEYQKLQDKFKDEAKPPKELTDAKKELDRIQKELDGIKDELDEGDIARWKRGGLARQFTPELIALCADREGIIREFAARALGKINPEAAPATDALGKLLKTGNTAECRAAADGLLDMLQSLIQVNKSRGSVGAEVTRRDLALCDRYVVPAAGLGVPNADATVRQTCLEAIRLGANTVYEIVLPEMKPNDLPPTGRTLTGYELGVIGAYRDTVEAERRMLVPAVDALAAQVPVVLRAVADPVAEVRLGACHALEAMGHARSRLSRKAASVPALPTEQRNNDLGRRGRSTSGSAAVRVAAALPAAEADKPADASDILAADPLGQPLQDTLGTLASRAVSDPRARVRLAAVDAIEPISRQAGSIVPTLSRALEDPNNFVRWASSRVIGKIGPVDPQLTVPLLAHLLKDGDLDVELSAANALGLYGPAAAAAVPALAAAVGTGDAERRVAAIHALQGIGTDNTKSAIPALIDALTFQGWNTSVEKDTRVRHSAAEALAEFGPAARSATPALERALRDVDPNVRKAAADALLSITAEK